MHIPLLHDSHRDVRTRSAPRWCTTSSLVTYGGAGRPILGRERESAVLDEVVDVLPERGAALLWRGEADMDKSTLLAASRWRHHRPSRRDGARRRVGRSLHLGVTGHTRTAASSALPPPWERSSTLFFTIVWKQNHD